jgi:hypothetical protein
LDSDCSIATTCSKVMRCAGSWVEGCGAIGSGAAGRCWAIAGPPRPSSNARAATAMTPIAVIAIKRVFMVSSNFSHWLDVDGCDAVDRQTE